MSEKSNDSFEKGVHPKCVEKYLLRYDKNICAVYIDTSDCLKEYKKTPIIAYLNKINSLYHQYLLIEKIDNELVFFKSVQSDELQSMNTQKFLDLFSNVFIGDFEGLIDQ